MKFGNLPCYSWRHRVHTMTLLIMSSNKAALYYIYLPFFLFFRFYKNDKTLQEIYYKTEFLLDWWVGQAEKGILWLTVRHCWNGYAQTLHVLSLLHDKWHRLIFMRRLHCFIFGFISLVSAFLFSNEISFSYGLLFFNLVQKVFAIFFSTHNLRNFVEIEMCWSKSEVCWFLLSTLTADIAEAVDSK